MIKNKAMLTLKEVAAYLDVSPTSIYRYVKQGKIPAIRVGNQWRFRTTKIQEWLKKMER
ncbi:MAG: helix-turn-helix domain-containing protein [Candidatus Omnitrophica bacterium]|nr:helix-turn-helix domain-containing protein [Candidatus Omnitrophota bacterium]